LTNSDRGGELHSQVVTEALKQYLNVESSQPAYIDMDTAALAEYAGTYRTALTDMALSADEAGGMWMDLTPRGGFPKPDSPPGPKAPACHIRFVHHDLAYAIDGAAKGNTVEFLRDDAGHITWARRGGRVHKRI